MTRDAAYLRELAGRFSSVPTMYGVNATDAQRLREIATKLERGADWPENDRPPGRPDLERHYCGDMKRAGAKCGDAPARYEEEMGE